MFIIGSCFVAFALPSAIITMRNIYLVNSNPYIYYFENGMTKSEATMLAIFYFSLLIVGVVLMIFGWMKRRNKAALESVINVETQLFCNSCKINVSKQCTNCPVCGNLLNNQKNKGE